MRVIPAFSWYSLKRTPCTYSSTSCGKKKNTRSLHDAKKNSMQEKCPPAKAANNTKACEGEPRENRGGKVAGCTIDKETRVGRFVAFATHAPPSRRTASAPEINLSRVKSGVTLPPFLTRKERMTVARPSYV